MPKCVPLKGSYGFVRKTATKTILPACSFRIWQMLSKTISFNGEWKRISWIIHNVSFCIRILFCLLTSTSSTWWPTIFDWHIKMRFIWEQSDLWLVWSKPNVDAERKENKTVHKWTKELFPNSFTVTVGRNIWEWRENAEAKKACNHFTVFHSNRNVFRTCSRFNFIRL